MTLDSNGQLANLVDSHDWAGLEKNVESTLPLTTWFNLTVYDKNLNILNPYPISNGGAISDKIVSVDYVCVSPEQRVCGLCFAVAVGGGGLAWANAVLEGTKSGQVLIVTALLVSLLLLSTALFVIETEKDVPTVDANQNNVFYTYKQSTRTTLISALANATDGGNPNILSADLNELKTVILANSYEAMLSVDCNTLNSSSYRNGLWISWGTNGQGVSSAYATFVFAASSPSATSNLEYALNVTSEVHLNGNYQQLTNTTKQVQLNNLLS